eukprot:scaffold161123_cov18-Tisochrysis_lutea.AAC.1
MHACERVQNCIIDKRALPITCLEAANVNIPSSCLHCRHSDVQLITRASCNLVIADLRNALTAALSASGCQQDLGLDVTNTAQQWLQGLGLEAE